ncbi:hypothetical protein [Lacticaseibacillus pantheris]|uniref:hypothetical protein n=1 Tax=Lacticaseibacillus pantheris TaxID=171523 RepID=UPI0026594E08|nr:hypothetical protein [Lacticaseibacillus pantheris]WKF84497.1 hypothetical protein QY874_09415 [Lacticaseibacillus pantheris]
MTLTTTKSITLDGQSKVGEVTVQTFHAQASTDGTAFNTSHVVLNQNLYEANKTDMRKDASDFVDEAYAVQDSIDAEQEATDDTTDQTTNSESTAESKA